MCTFDVPFWAWPWAFEFRPYNSCAVHGPEQINTDDDDECLVYPFLWFPYGIGVEGVESYISF